MKRRLLVSLLMGIIMGAVMSLIMTLTINGINSEFFKIWGRVYIKGFCIAFPAAFTVFPYVSRFVDYIMRKYNFQKPIIRRILFALIMPAFMDLIISSVANLSILGFSVPLEIFVKAWIKSYFNGYIVAVPLVFFISPIIFKLVDKILLKSKSN